MRSTRESAKGFTLVEILIVIIILGILAAIVIPTFSNASQDARKNSLLNQLQTFKTQVELYKLQHKQRYPTIDGTLATAWNWDLLTTATDSIGASVSSSPESFGPYIQAKLINPLVNAVGVDSTAVSRETAELAVTTGGTMPAITNAGGWAITPSGKLYATTVSGGKVFDETMPGNTQNDE